MYGSDAGIAGSDVVVATGVRERSRLEALDRVLVGALVTVFLLASFLPYFALIPLPSDTQPYALVLATLLAAASITRRVRRELILLFVPFALSLLMLLGNGMSLVAIRSVANYASIAVIPFVTYLAVRADRERFRRVLRFSVYVWLAGAILQIGLGQELFVLLLPSVRTSESRGVTSFAPEPTHYGLQCVFLLLLVLMEFDGKERMRLSAILVAQILFLAQSTLAALVLVGMLGLYLLTHINSPKRVLLLVLVTASAAGLVVLGVRASGIEIHRSRILFLAVALLKHPEYLFLVDQSGNARLAAILFSFYGFLADWTAPHGFSAYAEFVDETVARFSDVITHADRADRIMSGYGAALFELGLIGLLIPIVITIVFWRAFRSQPRQFIILCTTLHAILLAAIPLANPVIGVVVGYAALRATECEEAAAPPARAGGA